MIEHHRHPPRPSPFAIQCGVTTREVGEEASVQRGANHVDEYGLSGGKTIVDIGMTVKRSIPENERSEVDGCM